MSSLSTSYAAAPSSDPAPAAACAVPVTHRAPAHLARRFNQICLGIHAERREFQEVTPIAYALLVYIEADPGVDQRRLAEHLAIDQVTTSHLLDRMETMGLVERRVHPSDRRARTLGLTAQGAEARARMRSIAAACNDLILAPLSPHERTLFLGLLTRLVEGNKAYARPGNGRRPPRRNTAGQGGNHEDRI